MIRGSTVVRLVAAFVLCSYLHVGGGSAGAAPMPPSVTVSGTFFIDRDGDRVFGPFDLGVSIIEVVLTGPDGDPVVDVNGNPVESAFTENGRYAFTDLPLLEPGERYTVTVPAVEFGTGDALLLVSVGGVPVSDPSMASAQSAELTTPGAIDDTLDFIQVYNLPYLWIESFTTVEGPIAGDHDFDNVQQDLQPDERVDLTYQFTNAGSEDVVDLEIVNVQFLRTPADDEWREVFDVISPLECDYTAFGGPIGGGDWSGPVRVGESFTCTAQFQGMPAGSEFSSEVTVLGKGVSGRPILDDFDTWGARTSSDATPSTSSATPTTIDPGSPDPASTNVTTPSAELPETGRSTSTTWAAIVFIVLGAALVMAGRRAPTRR